MRIGMIGAGGIAGVHVEHLRGIEGVSVSAIADVELDRAKDLAATCGARAFTDYRDVLDLVDAVYVCSPPTFHREQVIAAVGARKHVFCEKPLATTVEDDRAIAEAVSSGSVRAMVGFNNRFRTPFRRLRALLQGGELGELVSAWILRVAPSTPEVGANWRTTPGLLSGVTIESASHDIDFIRWAFGEIRSVAARTSSSIPELDGYDDTLNALLLLEGGAAVSVCISWASAISTSSRGVIGTRGAASLEGPDMWAVSRLRWAASSESERVEEFGESEAADLGYREESEHFIRCLREDRAPDVSVNDGLAALEVSIALNEAADQGRMIRPTSRNGR